MPYLTVAHRGLHRFEVNVEGHRLIVDEGMAAGGRDAGPTPTELLAASLASCVAAYAESYMSSRGYPTSGLSVSCHYQLSTDYPRRVSALDVTVTTAVELAAEHRKSLMAAVERCMVGNTLRMPPQIHILLVAPEESTVG
jgi:uncharacterized OsmC-like protein